MSIEMCIRDSLLTNIISVSMGFFISVEVLDFAILEKNYNNDS